MCELIDCSMFDCFSNQQIFNDKEQIERKINIAALFQDSVCNFQLFKEQNQINSATKVVGLLSQVSDNIEILVEIMFNRNTVTTLTKNLYKSVPFNITLKQNKIIIAKQILKSTFLKSIQSSSTNFNFNTGEIFLYQTFYFTQQTTKSIKLILKKIIQKQICNNIKLFNSLGELSKAKIDESYNVQERKIYPILRYFSRCTIEPSISVKSQCAVYQSLMNRYAASRCDLEDLLNFNTNSYQTSINCFASMALFGLNFQIDYKSQYLTDIYLSQKQKIQFQILIPPLTLLKPKQNKFIFNHCYFLNQKYPQKKIAQGGNSEVFALKLDLYEYCSTSSDKDYENFQKNSNISNYISKHLVVKKLIDKQNLINIKYKASRQTQILSVLRGGTCQYLPKYYLNIQKNSLYHNNLFIEYIHGQTLDQYISMHSEIMSFSTKIWLLLQVIQSLRLINQFGIVHLDVKQQNIIVMKRLICKLFDFGQSYHYKVCGKAHKPKYTRLYASPEVVTSVNGRVFTQKSDTYSLGIMMHKILLGKYPYFFKDQQSFERCNFDKELRDKTFYIPQNFQDRGNEEIILILSQLILKCMDMDETKRPYLDWIAIVMKCCLNYIITQ